MLVKRARAERMVLELAQRAAVLKAALRYMHVVGKITVFGSYLSDKQILGDLDIAVNIRQRHGLRRDLRVGPGISMHEFRNWSFSAASAG